MALIKKKSSNLEKLPPVELMVQVLVIVEQIFDRPFIRYIPKSVFVIPKLVRNSTEVISGKITHLN